MTRGICLFSLLLVVGCSTPSGGPPPAGSGGESFPDQRLEQARTVARQGVPSATPQLDALVALVGRTTPELTLTELLVGQESRSPLRLRPGDSIQLSLVSHTELQGPHVIGLDGAIQAGSLGSIPAAGLTGGELSDRVADKLEEVYQEPRSTVGVLVVTQAIRSVKVVGRVRAHVADLAGGGSLLTTVVPIAANERLSLYDLVAQVQGLAADADDTRMALIRRPSGEAASPAQVFHFAYRDLLEAHVQGQKAWLQPDDQLIVPRLPDVFTYGAVRLPGRFPLRSGTTVTSLLLRAGGFSERADESRILILNGDQERPAEVGEALQPNDVVFIPSSQRVYVVGPGVLRNGPLNLPHQGLSAVQAISEAGWFTQAADMGDVQIQRFNEGRRLLIHVPVADILAGTTRESDYMLRPGDTVYVPEGLW